jgi:hypothetical protein
MSTCGELGAFLRRKETSVGKLERRIDWLRSALAR